VPNILFLTQVLPYPLDAGPKVRAYHMLRHLAGQHRVTLVSFVRPDDRPEYVAHLRGIAAAVHVVPMRRSPLRNLAAGIRGLLNGLPIAIARDDMPEMAALLRRLTADTRFDVIHADQLSMAWWGLLAAYPASSDGHTTASFASFVLRALREPLCLRAPDAPRLLLDEHNAIYRLTERMADEARGPRRWIMRREAAAFRRYEAAMLRAYDAVLTVTTKDRTLLEAIQEAEDSHLPFAICHLQSKLTVIPICIDPETVQPVQRAAQIRNPQSAICNPPTILHLGTMFWPPNVTGVLWFAREVLPLVWRQVAEARFVIVGKNPPAEVQALAADPRITVTGYVADPQPYLAAADAFVVPLFSGGGMRVKILDAWLWGLPIVATPLGAEGIEVRDGENILLAADAPAFAAAVLRLLTDAELNARLRRAGRAWVEQTYSWQAVYPKVDAVYAGLLASKSANQQISKSADE
jgi:glycosyltransferase involved in cell wall biosynthesis